MYCRSCLKLTLPSSGWPAPSLEECLDAVCKSNLFSSINFNSGYHQIPCTENAKRALPFSPGYAFRQLTWIVMPQGIQNASSCFQHTMCKTFSNHMNKTLPPYYDITITSTSFDHHYANVKCILQSVCNVGFTVNALKCSFFQEKIKYLGHTVHHNAIEIDKSCIQTILTMPIPHVSSLCWFIGMIQFCHQFLHNLNVLISPLSDLLKCHTTYSWSASCQKAFDTIKSFLISPPIPHSPSPQDTLVVKIDASNAGLGCCLKVLITITMNMLLVLTVTHLKITNNTGTLLRKKLMLLFM